MFYIDRLKAFRSYSFVTFRADFIAGIIVALVALPLAMSFAIAIGVKPEFGLYAAIIGGLIAALFGGSEVNVTGPTGAFVAILSGVVLKFGFEGLLVAGLIAGILLCIASIAKLGTLISYIPYPVTIGFTTGIATLIFTSQIGSMLGLTGVIKHEYFHENLLEIFKNIGTFSVSAIVITLLTIALMLIIPKINRRLPAALIAVSISAFVAYVLQFNVSTIFSAFGGIPQSLPSFNFPNIGLATIIKLLPSALAIAMLGSIESLLSCVVSDGMTRKKHNSNAELMGQGIANIVVPFFGGIPVTGAIARTAVNAKSGAQTRLASVFHAFILLAIMLICAPLVNFVPLAALGGVLAVVSYRMAELHHVKDLIKHADRTDVAVLVITILLTVFVNLTVSIPVGLSLASLIFMRRISELGVVPTTIDRNGTEPRFVPTNEQLTCEHLNIYTVQGPLFFGAARRFVSGLNSSTVNPAASLVLRMKHVPLIDATGLNALREILETSTYKNVYLSGVQPQVAEAMKKAGLDDLIPGYRILTNTREAINLCLKEQGLPDGCDDYKMV